MMLQARTLYVEGTLEIRIPEKQLNTGSLCVTVSGKSFQHWTEEEHSQSYTLIQKIARHFGNKTFLAFACHEPGASFSWEIVPYQDTNWFSNTYEDLLVAYNIVFGGNSPTPEMALQLEEEYTNVFPAPLSIDDKIEIIRGTDPFCLDKVIDKQQVFEGKLIRVLYDQTPIGAGDHQLHFLFIPKAHKKDFRELSPEEYKEAATLMQFVREKLLEMTSIYRFYHYHKTGRIQSVKHLHIHLVGTVSQEHDADTKTQLMVSTVFPSSKLDDETLVSRVKLYRSLFSNEKFLLQDMHASL